MAEVYEMIKDVKVSDRGLVWNSDLVETLELQNLLTVAMQKVVSASVSVDRVVDTVGGHEGVDGV